METTETSESDLLTQHVRHMIKLHNEVLVWAWALDPRAAIYAYVHMLGGLVGFYVKDHPDARGEMGRLLRGLAAEVALDSTLKR